VIERALSPQPELRFSTAEEMRAALLESLLPKKPASEAIVKQWSQTLLRAQERLEEESDGDQASSKMATSAEKPQGDGATAVERREATAPTLSEGETRRGLKE
jgi:hypothetical protein